HRLAAEFGIFPAEPSRNGNVQIQNHHRQTPSRPDSAKSKDRGEDRMQCPQPHDQPRHAGLRPGQIKREHQEKIEPSSYSCTNAVRGKKKHPVWSCAPLMRVLWLTAPSPISNTSQWTWRERGQN